MSDVTIKRFSPRFTVEVALETGINKNDELIDKLDEAIRELSKYKIRAMFELKRIDKNYDF